MSARVHFENIERDCFLIVINAYIDTKDLAEYKCIEEDLNLHVLNILADRDIKLAIPEQQIFLSRKSRYDD